MCGRITLKTKAADVSRKFLVELSKAQRDGIVPRYNIAPSSGVLAVWDDRDAGERKADFLHWGLVPSWAKDVKIGHQLTNARSETAAAKPSFAQALRYRRCLVPCDGFYEWRRVSDTKEPFYFQVGGGGLFALAGLWEIWQSADGSEIWSLALLTTGPNALMAPIHDRMPVIIAPKDFDRWLDPRQTDGGSVADLMRPFPAEKMTRHAVSPRVNSARHDGPDLIEPVPEAPHGAPGGRSQAPVALDFFDQLFGGEDRRS